MFDLMKQMYYRSRVTITISGRYVGLAGYGLLAFALGYLSPAQTFAQESEPRVIVQPGAPGQPTRALPSSTRAVLPKRSQKDTEFMQGMIVHHAQAVEMTALIESRTKNRDIRLLGERISKSQMDEIEFMKRWLVIQGESISTKEMAHAHSHTSGDQMLMPGMLTKKQMDALRKAEGPQFDRLFLSGMIKHHKGALAMVKDLFETAGAGQDAVLFNFATDVDSGQRAEIRTMEALLRANR